MLLNVNEDLNLQIKSFLYVKSLSIFFFSLFVCSGLRDTLWCMVYLCMHRASFLSETDHYFLISVYETAAYIVSLGEHYISISACTSP